MRGFCSFREVVCLLVALISTWDAFAAAPQAPTSQAPTAKAAAAPKASTVYSMPDAYSGMAYNATLVLGAPGWKQPATCVPVPALPAWMKLDCSGSNFKYTGSVPAVSKDVIMTFAVTVVDANDKDFHYKFKLTVRPVAETVELDAKAVAAAAAAEKATTVAPDYTKVKLLLQTIPIQEGATQAAGQLAGVPPNASLHLQVWTKLENAAGPLALMPLQSPTTPPATVSQGDLKNNAYALQFTAPLAAGQDLQLVAVTDDGTQLAPPLLNLTLPSAIQVDAIKVKIEPPLSAGAKSITVKLSNMPVPAVKPIAGSGATPPFYGNFPGIVVLWTDPQSGIWTQASPTLGVNPQQFLSVNPDGSLTVALPSALVPGQKVRASVVAPPGRSFAPKPPLAALPAMESNDVTVLTDVALSKPTVASAPFNEGITVIAGTATIPPAGVPLNIAVMRMRSQAHGMVPTVETCPTVDDLEPPKDGTRHPIGVFLPLTGTASNSLLGTVDSTGAYKVTLIDALKEGERVEVVQVLPAGTTLPVRQRSRCASDPQEVKYPFDFHRTNLTFVAGVLLSNSSSGNTTNANFSQANQFYAFNADRAWKLPGYNCVDGLRWGRTESGECRAGNSRKDGWHADVWPGISTFFEGRLTAIPVSTASTTVTPSTTTTTTSTMSTLLTSQKVFRVLTGAFLPWVVTHGQGENPNGLFIAPLAKAGFDTVTGAGTSNNVILPGGTLGTLNFQTAYKFYVYGARVGNMSLSQSSNRAPLLQHYLDVTFGRYSNLQSYICHKLKPGEPPSTPLPGSSCLADYPNLFTAANQVVESRKQLYRLDIEGLVRVPIPATLIPFYIGFNANIAQHMWQAENLDHGYAPPDDIRILLGTKIDIGTLLSSFKLGAY